MDTSKNGKNLLKHALRLFILAVCLILQSVIFTPFAQAQSGDQDPRLKTFLEKSKLFFKTRKPIDHSDSPFSPYLNKSIEEGLTKIDLLEFRQSQRTGKCIIVDKLILKGFLNLYPFLKPALRDGSMPTRLSYALTRKHPAILFCHVNKSLNEIYADVSMEKFPALDMGIASPLYLYHNRLQGRGSINRQLRIKLFSLGQIAFCDDHNLAIEKLLASANRNGGIMLSTEEMIYILERSKQNNLKIPRYDLEMRSASELMTQKHFDAIRLASRTALIEFLPPMHGYWQKACKSRRTYRNRHAQE